MTWNDILLKLKEKSPHLLTGFGVAGVFATGISSAFATKRYLQESEGKDKKGKLKTAIKCYGPTAALAFSSAACIIGSDVENTRRQTVLAEACNMASAALTDYRAKVSELMGEKADNDICKEVNNDYAKLGEPNKKVDMVVLSGNRQRVYDMYSGRYIYTSLDELRDVEIEANRRLRHEQSMSVNDIYDLFENAERTPAGNNEGFNINMKSHDEIRFGYDSKLGSDKQAYLAFYFEVEPTDKYMIF